MNDDELIKTIKQHLDASAKHPAHDVTQSLSQIRQSALDKAERHSGLMQILFNPLWEHKAVSVFASIAVLATVLVLFNQPQTAHTELNDIAEFELLMSEDNLEFYEDLEFYQWLLLEDQQSG